MRRKVDRKRKPTQEVSNWYKNALFSISKEQKKSPPETSQISVKSPKLTLKRWGFFFYQDKLCLQLFLWREQRKKFPQMLWKKKCGNFCAHKWHKMSKLSSQRQPRMEVKLAGVEGVGLAGRISI